MKKRPRVLDYPKVTIKTLYNLLPKGTDTGAFRYDFVWTATTTGWATDGKLLVKLSKEAIRQWKSIPDPQCHPAYGKAGKTKKEVPFRELLDRLEKTKCGPAVEPAVELKWDDFLMEVTCTLPDAKGDRTLSGLHVALVRLLWPDATWHVTRNTKGMTYAVAKCGGELVAVLAPLV